MYSLSQICYPCFNYYNVQKYIFLSKEKKKNIN